MYYKRRRKQQSLAPTLVLLLLVLGAVTLATTPTLAGGFDLVVSVLIACAVLASGGVIGVALYLRHQRRERMRALALSDVDRMTGTEFEEYLALVFAARGWRVTHTGRTGDFGTDLLLVGDGERVVVQLKRYSGSVGIEAVQQAVAARAFYRASKSMVVTNSFYTPAARRLAQINGCELVDREKLAEWIRAFQEARPAAS